MTVIAEELLRNLLDLTDTQAWIQDVDTYHWANRAHAEFMGITQNQFRNVKLNKVHCQEEVTECLLSNRAVIEEKRYIKSTEWLKNKHGEKRLLSITKVPFKNDKGEVKYILCKAEDVTEKIRLRDELEVTYTRLQSILESQNDFIFRFSPELNYTFANRAYSNLYNKEPDDLIGKNFWDLIPLEKKETIINFISIITPQNPVGFLEINHKNNLNIHWVCKAILDQKDEIIEYQAVGRDITEFKQVENKLRQNKETLELEVYKRTEKLIQLNADLENQIIERKKTEAILRKRHEFEKVLLNVSSRFIKVLNIDDAINDALRDLGIISQADRSYVFLFKEEGKIMDNTHEWCAKRVTSHMAKLKNLPCDKFPWWVQKIKAYQHIHISDVTELPLEAKAEKEILEMRNIKSLIALPLVAKGEVIGFIVLDEIEEIDVWTKEDMTLLLLFSEMIGNAIERDLSRQELKYSNKKLQNLLNDTVKLLASTIGMVDLYTAGHQHKVAEIACEIARYMELPEERIEGIRVAALLHDIGKLHVPATILSKPGDLTKNEFNLIKEHTTMGYKILKEANFPWEIAEFVLQHHERLDGSGYPKGITGDKIHLEAKIIAVADVVEAMTSHRPYRPAQNKERAKKEILSNKGVFYDPVVVDACIETFFNIGHQQQATI